MGDSLSHLDDLLVVSYVLNLNKYAKSFRQEGEHKVRVSSKGLPRLGTLFSQILSPLCL